MGGWDNYCPLCGVVLSTIHLDGQYDRSIFQNKNDTSWTNEIVVICINPNITTLSTAYVTGMGWSADYGSYEVSRGKDVNFDVGLVSSEVDPADQTKSLYIMNAPQWHGEGHPFAIPMHDFCYRQILPRIIDFYTSVGSTSRVCEPCTINKDTLYYVLKSLYTQDPFPRFTDWMDFGDASCNQDQFWTDAEGQEWLVMHPGEIAGLLEIYQNLPKLSDHVTKVRTFTRYTENGFSLLPEHLILRVMSYLSLEDINAFRASTPAIAQIQLPSSFWKSYIICHLPWLYDLPYDEQGVDWSAVCVRLKRLSHKDCPRKIHGLANRRRIWKICSQVARLYIQREDQDGGKMHRPQLELLSQASSSRMPLLIWPEPSDGETGIILFVDDAVNIRRQRLVISVDYDAEKMALTSLSIAGHPEENKLTSIGPVKSCVPLYTFVIEEGDWITGFILYSLKHGDPDHRRGEQRSICGMKILTKHSKQYSVAQTEGDCRIFHVSKGNMAIGLSGVWSRKKGIYKLGLLEIPAESRLYADVTDMNDLAGYAESDVSHYLWKSSIPPQNLIVGEFQSGYWNLNPVPDVAEREYIILGTTEAELSSITAVAIDVNLGSFRIDYSNQKSKTIGPRAVAMQILQVDGKRGERVIAMETVTSHVTQGLRLITNQGQQLIIGLIAGDNRKRFATDGTRVLSGICAHWIKSTTPEARLELIAAAFLPHDRPAPHFDASESAQQPFSTEISLLPSCWDTEGVVMGQEVMAERSTVLDFTLPLDKLDICLTHGMGKDGQYRLPLMSIILTYEDQTVASAGPTEFRSDVAGNSVDGSEWCWCYYSRPDRDGMERSHYHVESWALHQQRVRNLRVWLHDGILSGIQFVAEDGTTSPQWGDCSEPPAHTIIYSIENNITGLLCFIGSNSRPVTYPDIIVHALQALRKH